MKLVVVDVSAELVMVVLAIVVPTDKTVVEVIAELVVVVILVDDDTLVVEVFNGIVEAVEVILRVVETELLLV